MWTRLRFSIRFSFFVSGLGVESFGTEAGTVKRWKDADTEELVAEACRQLGIAPPSARRGDGPAVWERALALVCDELECTGE